VGSISEMASFHVELNTVTYSAAVSVCSERGSGIEVFVEMASARMELNTITDNAAVSTFEKGGEWGQASRT